MRRLAISIQGVLGSSLARTEEQCRSLGIVRAYESMDELARDGSVDVVHICTPNHVHFQQAESALRAGKHVMCESRGENAQKLPPWFRWHKSTEKWEP